MHFFGSEHGFLATPEQCGTYEVKNVFVPWDSALSTQESTSFVTINSGPNRCTCPNGPRPFDPTFAAGSTNGTLACAPDHPPAEPARRGPNVTGIAVKTPAGVRGHRQGRSLLLREGDLEGHGGGVHRERPSRPHRRARLPVRSG